MSKLRTRILELIDAYEEESQRDHGMSASGIYAAVASNLRNILDWEDREEEDRTRQRSADFRSRMDETLKRITKLQNEPLPPVKPVYPMRGRTDCGCDPKEDKESKSSTPLRECDHCHIMRPSSVLFAGGPLWFCETCLLELDKQIEVPKEENEQITPGTPPRECVWCEKKSASGKSVFNMWFCDACLMEAAKQIEAPEDPE